MGTPLIAEVPHPKAGKKLVRRLRTDRSQMVRHLVQWAFVALNLCLGIEFFLWVSFTIATLKDER